MSKEKVSELLEQRGGYLTAKEAREEGIPNKDLQRLTTYGELDRVAHGLYVREDVFADPYFVAQYRCPKGIFSHDTALYLHDLCDRVPLRLTMTIPSGWNTTLLKEEDFVFYYCGPKRIGLGICDIPTSYGKRVKAYGIERTLCDCIRHIEKLDRDLVLTGLKRYIKGEMKDSAKLLEYANVFNIRDIVYRYLEVLV